MEKKEKRKLSAGVWVLVIFLSIVFIVMNPINLLLLPISFIIAFKCYDWAKEIKDNPTTAFILGFVFSLISLLIYWSRYKKKAKPKKEKKIVISKKEIENAEKEDTKNLLFMVKMVVGFLLLVGLYFLIKWIFF